MKGSPDRRLLAAIHPERRGSIVCDRCEVKTIRQLEACTVALNRQVTLPGPCQLTQRGH